ncbi:MAG TPA: hypothetical protein VFL83_04035 [Anaeromyxobacter sp.]|nr:hypothetical protein [Anaeromyxobacter sp.]
MRVRGLPWSTARALAALAAFGCLASGGRAGAASLQVEGGAIVLGRTESAAVVIRVDEPPGAEEQPLRLSVNVGSFSEPARLGPGKYRAVYVPPATRFPQVALVAVWRETGPEAPIDFLRIPLFGMTRIRVTAAPGADARARVGVDEFGPVRVNRRGQAEIPIVVEPGVKQCDVVIAEPGAAPATKRLPVEVPPYNRLTAALVPHAVVADGKGRVRLDVFYDLGGADVPPDRIQVAASAGGVSLLRASRGRYSYEYVPPAGAAAASASFAITVAGDEEAVAAAKVALGLPAPARVVVTPPASRVAVGSGTTAIASALVLDAAGMGLPGLQLSAVANGHPLPPPLDRGGGRYDVPCPAPATYPPGGLFQLQVTAAARGGGARAQGSANWQLDAAPVPRSVSARLVPSPVPADGRTEAVVVFDVRDAAGMPLQHAQFMAMASHGRVGTVMERGDGLYEATYVAPAALPSGESVLRVVDGSGSFERTLPLPLRQPQRRVLLGVGGGYTLAPGAAAGVRGRADLWVPFRIGGAALGAGVSAGYGRAERTVSDATGSLQSVTRATFVPVALRVGYEVLAGRRASLTLGAGAVAAWARFESSLASAVEEGWGAGAVTFASASWAVGPGHAFGEVSWSSAAVETESYRIDPGGPAITLGYRLAVF